ncbi:hypothetical protein [Phenylobacterium sp.]|uniref:class I SAM-dependent methyltransferase n=1 Tax=Phenylobacterium sp. TaxID=1871053 RepID=UPI0035AFDC21
MKLNMGCGHNRIEEFVNVDAAAECQPDVVWDLEIAPWPWPDDCAEEVRFIHSLEHMGGDPKAFLAIMKELYRICAPGARVVIHAPHPRHDNFISDPTHVRPITPATLQLFDRELNDAWRAARVANTPLAHYTDVDFRLAERSAVLAEPYASQLSAGTLSSAEVDLLARERNNIVAEYRLTLVARKTRPSGAS